jgi:bifunctional non-homologous end joining protein LigD
MPTGQPIDRGASGQKAAPDSRLKAYEEKRDFSVTAEPSPEVPAPSTTGRRYMIQKHDATRLHYDLRLETEGVLASWACPKGPSYDPAAKHLAIETEDHPLAYGGFEGRIPDGEYGAGDSLIWDRGLYETMPPGNFEAQKKKGHLHLVFVGEKLDGGWHLVRTRPAGNKEQWLFFKAQDGTERPGYEVLAERPESVESGRRTTRGPTRAAGLRHPVVPGHDKAPDEPGLDRPRPQVKVTHPDKVMFPRLGYSKADVRAYFEAVAPAMVPALSGRPLSFQQFPSGIGKAGFFRHDAQTAPDWVQKVKIKHSDRVVNNLVVDSTEALYWLANQSALTIHIPSSRVEALFEPDWVAFDFDPVDGGWADLITLVEGLHGLLDELKLPSVPKTSGKRGLHVLVPIGPGHTHEQATGFATAVTGVLAQKFKTLATVERMKRSRGNRLYLDAGQNGLLRTVVAPYSLRAVEEATVSTPLVWDEVDERLDPLTFTIKTVPRRVETLGDLFTPALHGTARLPDLST